MSLCSSVYKSGSVVNCFPGVRRSGSRAVQLSAHRCCPPRYSAPCRLVILPRTEVGLSQSDARESAHSEQCKSGSATSAQCETRWLETFVYSGEHCNTVVDIWLNCLHRVYVVCEPYLQILSSHCHSILNYCTEPDCTDSVTSLGIHQLSAHIITLKRYSPSSSPSNVISHIMAFHFSLGVFHPHGMRNVIRHHCPTRRVLLDLLVLCFFGFSSFLLLSSFTLSFFPLSPLLCCCMLLPLFTDMRQHIAVMPIRPLATDAAQTVNA